MVERGTIGPGACFLEGTDASNGAWIFDADYQSPAGATAADMLAQGPPLGS